MPYSRYLNRPTFVNQNEQYRSAFFEDRAVKQIEQYESPEIGYPTQGQIDALTNISDVWTASSKLYNLAYVHYGDPSYWWVIAWYNRKPTEGHFEIGDVFYIPLPLSRAVELFNR